MTTDTARRAYRIAYDGTGYHGFQRQPDVATISDAVLDALRALDVIGSSVPQSYSAAGRTDASVSALAQTIALDVPGWLKPAALNAELPADIHAWAHTNVYCNFHATHDATCREYTYYLFAPNSDVGRARKALKGLTGRHDFHNLTPDEANTVRTLKGSLEVEDEFFEITISSDGFPRQLVRRLISVIDNVASGETPLSILDSVFGDESLSGPTGIKPAPGAPLVLTDVSYPNVSFSVDAAAAERTRSTFGEDYSSLLARARVSEKISNSVGE